MSIQSSLYSGISGLTTNGNAMSIIGNNIANTNTIGFKSSRAVFSDLLSSSISGSGGESQIGRGVGLSTVDNIFAQGTFEATESNTDLAVEGSGFFMMREASGQELQFSRAGAFRFNSNGNLINPEGFFVQGYTLDADANPIGDVIDIQVATATSGYTPANPTSSVTLSTNLNSKTPYITSNATQGSATASGLELNVLANDVSLSDPNLILTIEGEPIAVAGGGTAQQGSAKNIADGINAAAIGVTASITAPTLDLGDISLAGATLDLTGANLTINGYNIEGTLHQGTNLLQELRTLINARSAETNVTAMAGATQLLLTAADGENIQVQTDGAVIGETLLSNFNLDAAAERTAFGGLTITKPGELAIDTGLGAGYGVQITAGPPTGSDPYFDVDDPTATSNYATSIRVFDSFGDTHLVTNYFVKRDPDVDPNQWDIYTLVDSGELSGGTPGTNVLVGTQTMIFDTTGALAVPVTLQTNAAALNWANGSAQAQQISFVMATTQYASDFVVNSQSQDGFASGTLVGLDIDSDGIIYGKYSNGEPRPLAQLALATFNNAGGLVKKGSNMWAATTDSGPAVIGTVGSGVGKLFTNSLEQSNVDLAQEFVKMITIQRGFQANSRVITTTDEMMTELLNLKR
jgi:flagellar hook protein FlgE